MTVFSTLAKSLYLFRDLFQHNAHAVLHGSRQIFHACQSLIDAGRIVVHIIQVRKAQKLSYIGIADTSHGLEDLALTVKLRATGGHCVRFREDHAGEIKYFCVGRAGILHVWQPQSGGNGFCAHGLASTGRPAQQEVSHLHGPPGGLLRMLANIHHLRRNDIPFREFRNQALLQRAQCASRRQGILADEIRMLHHDAGFFDNGRSGLGKDREFPGCDAGGHKGSGIQLTLRDPHQVSGLVHCDIDMRRAGIVLDSAVGIVAEDCHAFGRLCHIRVSGNELVVVLLKGFIELHI